MITERNRRVKKSESSPDFDEIKGDVPPCRPAADNGLTTLGETLVVNPDLRG
jgi:hypothetical protein